MNSEWGTHRWGSVTMGARKGSYTVGACKGSYPVYYLLRDGCVCGRRTRLKWQAALQEIHNTTP